MIGISILALMASLSSAVISWRALDQAGTARGIALARSPATAPSAPLNPVGGTSVAAGPTGGSEGVPASGDVPEGVPRSPGEPPELNERTVYGVKYDKQSLTLNPSECYKQMRVDLDEPRANVGEGGYDFRLDLGCGAEAPFVELAPGVDGSESTRPGMTPQECADAIRSAPIAEEAKVPVRKGVALCFSTNYAAARERRDPWRMVLVEVVSVSNDRTVVIQATAWDIPD